MRYFSDRAHAGREIAAALVKYKAENTAVIALSEGAILVAEQIAKAVNGTLCMLVTDDVYIPGESTPLATMTSTGTYTYNQSYSTGQIEEFVNEYRGLIEEQRMRSFHKINRIVGKDGEVDMRLLKRHVVILVSDGLMSGTSLDVAADFLKPITLQRLIVATPMASVQAVDRMHILADEIQCLNVLDSFISVDHYYEDNTLPDHDGVLQIMKNVVFAWDTDIADTSKST
jgi:putative phosphoribosyl transferase